MSPAEELPAPLVPAEVDLRDFAFMPLDVLRLRDSDLASVEDAEVFRCSVLSWCVSWHQTPAGSLPDDDVLLARLLGFGRDIKGWRRVRAAGGMRGWLKCTDGRLYHAVVAEKARDAWVGKMAQRWRTECARIKKHNQRHKLEGDAAVQFPDFDVWMSQGCPQGQPLPVPGTKADGPQGQAPSVPRETASKGQGEGQGQGQGDLISEASASGAAAAPPIPPTDRDLVFANGVTLLTAAGVSDKNARSFLAAQCKAHGERAVRLALERCATERPIEPVPWLVESLKAAPAGRSASKPDRIAAQNADVVRRFAERNPQ